MTTVARAHRLHAFTASVHCRKPTTRSASAPALPAGPCLPRTISTLTRINGRSQSHAPPSQARRGPCARCVTAAACHTASQQATPDPAAAPGTPTSQHEHKSLATPQNEVSGRSRRAGGGPRLGLHILKALAAVYHAPPIHFLRDARPPARCHTSRQQCCQQLLPKPADQLAPRRERGPCPRCRASQDFTRACAVERARASCGEHACVLLNNRVPLWRDKGAAGKSRPAA